MTDQDCKTIEQYRDLLYGNLIEDSEGRFECELCYAMIVDVPTAELSNAEEAMALVQKWPIEKQEHRPHCKFTEIRIRLGLEKANDPLWRAIRELTDRVEALDNRLYAFEEDRR